ncbi:MAG TPA: Asp23/Gls24 family envelope stress response protein [Opitutales bacterium]|nr:Asp23/Gls24 family envelope stress response protein [Opitutales bacterium]
MEKNSKDTSSKTLTEPALEVDNASVAEENNAGVIKVSHEVVANIVRIAVQAVSGVISVGGPGGLKEEFAGLFNRRDSTPGITVCETERGAYEVTVKVILRFGVELAKVGEEIQNAVREQVTRMTNKKVARVDVLIEGVRMADKDEKSAALIP